jgi:phosphatidylinositol alpha-mannosyltransferase
MVLTEAFAHGTPVVASDIAGYRDVVRDGRDGVLVPRGDAAALAGALRDLHEDPARRAELGRSARERAERFAWPHVAGEVLDAYAEARELAAPPKGSLTVSRRAAERVGAVPADGRPRVPAQRLPSPEPPLESGRRRPALAALRRVATLLALAVGVFLAYSALQRIGIDKIGRSLLDSSPAWVLTGLALMCASMVVRGVAWHAILKAALPRARVKLGDALQGTFIGVLMSATLPARLGEPSRALIVARRSGRPRDNLPAILGTIVSQTLLNLVALLILGAVMLSSIDFFHGHQRGLLLISIAPLVLLVVVVIAPAIVRRGAQPQLRAALARVRSGLAVFRRPRLAAVATGAQLSAWVIQWLACYVLLVALGLDHQAGLAAAAAVLFAVNVTAAVPATPSNLGVFQAACVAVLHGAYHIGAADALGYGIVLQAVEIATAVIMGAPALVKEGVSWKDVKLRAMHTSPVELPARESSEKRRRGLKVEA